MIVQEVQDGVYITVSGKLRLIAHVDHTRLLPLKTDDTPGKLPIHVQCLLAGNGMSADDRVYVDHWLTPHNTSSLPRARIICLFVTRVLRFQRFQEGDKFWGEPL